MKTRVLVTGHEGFIGRNLTGWLHQQGYYVEGWEWAENEFPNVKAFDWVIHLGALTNSEDVDQLLKQNFDFSQKLFIECQHYGVHMQYASCSDVYGDTNDFSEYAPCHPRTPYTWSKYLFDRWVFQQSPLYYVQGFRYFDVYGKWMSPDTSLISKWIHQAKEHGTITLYDGDDHIKRDWVWVGDVCKIHTDFIETVRGSGIWNVGSGLAHTLVDIAETIADQEGAKIQVIARPINEMSNFRQTTCANLKHLKETIGKRKWLNLYEWLSTE